MVANYAAMETVLSSDRKNSGVLVPSLPFQGKSYDAGLDLDPLEYSMLSKCVGQAETGQIGHIGH